MPIFRTRFRRKLGTVQLYVYIYCEGSNFFETTQRYTSAQRPVNRRHRTPILVVRKPEGRKFISLHPRDERCGDNERIRFMKPRAAVAARILTTKEISPRIDPYKDGTERNSEILQLGL